MTSERQHWRIFTIRISIIILVYTSKRRILGFRQQNHLVYNLLWLMKHSTTYVQYFAVPFDIVKGGIFLHLSFHSFYFGVVSFAFPFYCRPAWKCSWNRPSSLLAVTTLPLISHLSLSLSISLSLSLSRATRKISWFPEMLQNVGRGSLNDWCKRLNGGSSCDLSTRQSTEAHHWISGTLSVSSWFRHDCLLFRFFSFHFHFHFHFLHFLFLSDPFQL